MTFHGAAFADRSTGFEVIAGVFMAMRLRRRDK